MKRLFVLPILAALSMAAPARAQYYRPPPPAPYAGAPRAMVDSWYRRYLRRPMEPAAEGWVQLLENGTSPLMVQAQILGSDEYYRRAGGTPRAFVYRLFRDVVGRRPTREEMDRYARMLRSYSAQDVAYRVLSRYPPDYGDEEEDSPRYEYRRSFDSYRR